MKLKKKIDLTFGDLITAAYKTLGAVKAEKMLRLAINARLVIFEKLPNVLIPSAKGASL